jgi:hypothetical protein
MESRNYSGGVSKGRSIKILITDDDIGKPTKWCSQCRHWLPMSMFYKNKYKYSGLSSECKKCNNAERAKRKERKRNA